MLDFSEFHPLDHHVLNPVCSGWYGGEIQHIKLWWEYQLNPFDRLYESYRRLVYCRRDIHRKTGYWNDLPEIDYDTGEPITPPTGYLCEDCEWSST